MSQRKVSIYQYMSLARSCASDARRVVDDTEDSIVGVGISDAESARRNIDNLRALSKSIREQSKRLAAIAKSINGAIAEIDPKKKAKKESDARQLPLPHT